jgi:erythronate-4-phosphate dehydrogenase
MRHVVVADEQIPKISEVLRGCEVVSVRASEITHQLLQQTSATALLVRSTTAVSYDLLRDTQVTFVGSATAGMDHIEPALIQDRNIRVVGAPGCNANAVAEYVMIWLRHLKGDSTQPLGIIGFGNVGQRLARYAVARGHRVLVNDPPLADVGFTFPDCIEHVSLDHLIEHSHIISVHTPYLTSGPYATHNLINADRIERVQRGGIIINTARGGIVNEHALCKRVAADDISCVLDVFASEPNVNMDTIRTASHVTPHIAGYSITAKLQGARMVLKALRASTEIDFEIPELHDLVLAESDAIDDASIITEHPFRRIWLADPTSETFEMCRRLTPLRTEHTQPPIWEELHGHRS